MSYVHRNLPPPGILRDCGGMPLVTWWEYHDAAGQVLGYTARYGDGEAKKVLPFFLRDNGSWKSGRASGPQPLYRLDTIASASPGQTLYVCEGEKCVCTLLQLQLTAVTSGSATSAGTADWQPMAPFRKVIVLPDQDEPGRDYARAVSRRLAELHGSREIWVCNLPSLEPGGDIVDWVQARVRGWDGYGPLPSDSVDRLREELERLVGELAQPIPSEWCIGASDDWPEPEPLPDELPTVEPFAFELLPDAFRPWIEDIAERMQCPPDFPAIGAMVGLSAAVGRRVAIRPKREDDWDVVPNLWGAAVGPPGILKTPALREPLRPLQNLENEAALEYEAESQTYHVQKLVQDEHIQAVKRDVRKKVTKDEEGALALAKEVLDCQCTAPVCRRYVVNDTTVEKLGEILSGNPNGVLVFRDELTGLLRMLDKEGHECDRSFYIEAWDGRGAFTYDRIGRGTIRIPACCVSILGCIQPGPLREYLEAAMRGGVGDDGLIQRFQLAVWPDIAKTWCNVDRRPNTAARDEAYRAIKKLACLDPSLMGAVQDEGFLPYLRFADDAQPIFDEWRAELETELRENDEHPALVAYLAKFRSLVPSLALLVHLADGGVGAVGAASLAKACAWGDYLESHARRLYGAVIGGEVGAAKRLLRHIVRGDLGDHFALRAVYRKGWAGLSDRVAAQMAIDVLLDYGYLRAESQTTGGRPSQAFRVNPRALK